MTVPLGHTWRVIIEDEPHGGAWNMAMDRAIQLERAEARQPATLRLYRWERPTISLGRFQTVDSIDLDECRASGVDVVRRFTGGKGVLHDAELTYSVVAAVEDGMPRGVPASYSLLCSALVEAYRRLGVDADLTRGSRGSRSSGACYLHATRADVSFRDRKLSGSAQGWYRDVVLQHGSFVLGRDTELESRLFRLTPAQTEDLSVTTATLADIVVPLPTIDELVTALVSATEDVLGVTLSPGAPTHRETSRAERLLAATRIGGTLRQAGSGARTQ